MVDYWDVILEDLKSILSEEGIKPTRDAEEVQSYIREISRSVDPELIEEIKTYLGQYILSIITDGELKFSLVVDANIIISDAFRVARNIPSTTDRIFSSPVLELIAPPIIVSEVDRQIRLDLPANASLEAALDWAQKLLSKVKLVDDPQIFDRCSNKFDEFKDKFGNDVDYLCLAIYSKSKGIISHDKKAFGNSNESIKRFQLKDVVELVISQESGLLVLSGMSMGFVSLSELSYWVLYILYSTILELIGYVSAFLASSIYEISYLLKIMPSWVWYIIGGIIVTGGILFIFSKWFSNSIKSKGKKVYQIVVSTLESLEIELTYTLNKLKDLIESCAAQLGPYFEPLIWGLILTITDMRNPYRQL